MQKSNQNHDNSIFEGLNPPQAEAVAYTNGPLLILAGAGSGKTRVITHRIAHLIKNEGVNAGNILAITFTNKAAKEMKGRAEDLVGNDMGGIRISTFHSFGASILRRFANRLGYKNSFSICDDYDKKKRVKDACKRFFVADYDYGSAISNAKMRLLNPEDVTNDAELCYIRGLQDVYEAYEERLHTDNAFDFDDLIKHSVELFEQFPDVLRAYQAKYRYIMVDEYQDTDHAQFRLIELLADKYRNICVVGDDDQSIYSFRGADISNILDFQDEYPEAKVVKLEENYRSTKTILQAANNVIHHNVNRTDKTLFTNNEVGEGITVLQTNDQVDEASYIANSILTKVGEGVPFSSFAVLYRLHSQSKPIEAAMLSNKIPYMIVGGTKYYDRHEIRDVLAFLRVINDPNDSVSLKRIINVPARGISKATVDSLEAYAFQNGLSLYEACLKMPGLKDKPRKCVDDFLALIEGLRDKLNKDGLYTGFIPDVLREVKYWEALNKIAEDDMDYSEREGNIHELTLKLCDYIADEETPTLTGFLENISLIADGNEENKNVVSLMTLHAAKGLEFDHVFIPGAEDDILPFIKSTDIEEERRLMYVGITRAKKTLALTYVDERTINGFTRECIPSPFLDEMYEGVNKWTAQKSKEGPYVETGRIQETARISQFSGRGLPGPHRDHSSVQKRHSIWMRTEST